MSRWQPRQTVHRGAVSEATVESVNVGRPRSVPVRGGVVQTAIWKSPAMGPVAVRGVNVAGDDQADRAVHGGRDKAVYAYGADDLAWWSRQVGHDLPPGTLGENLTISGMDVQAAVIGERWAIGSTVLEVAQPRVPCYKLAIRMGDARFPRRFAAAGRPGAYLRIVSEGELQSGDRLRIIERPAHGVSIGLVNWAYLADHSLATRLLQAPQLPVPLRHWAHQVLSRETEPS